MSMNVDLNEENEQLGVRLMAKLNVLDFEVAHVAFYDSLCRLLAIQSPLYFDSHCRFLGWQL